MYVPERVLIDTTCANGRIVVTDQRVIIRTVRGFSRQEQSIPRGTITGVDCTMKVMGAEITIHRAGGNAVSVKTLTKKAANEIRTLLS